MKTLKNLASIILLSGFLFLGIFGCSENGGNLLVDSISSSTNEYKEAAEFIHEDYDEFEQIKIQISEALYNWSASNDQNALVQALSQYDGPTSGVLIGDFDKLTVNGKNLSEIILNNLNDSNIELSEACQQYPHLAITLPPWYSVIPESERDQLTYGVFPSLYKLGETWKGYQLGGDQGVIELSKSSAYELVPIRVSEAEDVIPINASNQTLQGEDVFETHFPHTSFCLDLLSNIDNFLVNVECNSEYRLLDIMSFRDFLRENCEMRPEMKEICDNGIDDDGDGLVDEDDPDCMQEEICGNGIDDDEDGEIDEGCREICNNGIDDDGDGDIDGNDDDCIMGGEICTNGVDDDGDGLVDGWDPDCYPGTELCNNNYDDDGDGLIDSNDPDCVCKIKCERDCVQEKNVLEGIKLANLTVFKGINNQPGGEEVMSLHYTIVSSRMCGDLTKSQDCPPTTWKKIFWGTFSDFYELQYHTGTPTDAELKDLVFVSWGRYYVKAFPIYYDIPEDFSSEGIYSQMPYLQNTAGSHWDGDLYGSVVSFSIHEHDEVIVKQTTKKTIKVVNTAKVSLGLTASVLKIEGSFNFDYTNTVERISEYTYEIEAEKDVELGQHTSVYCDQIYQNSTIGFGINKTTGSVTSHLAFYY